MKKKLPSNTIILFDGFCNLCSWSVNFIIKRDKQDLFRFASLQSEIGQQVLSNHGSIDDMDDSVVLITNNKVYIKSEAALRIAKNLRGAWPLLYAFMVIPKVIRDSVYDLIARNRFKWFGKRTSCHLPRENHSYKFL